MSVKATAIPEMGVELEMGVALTAILTMEPVSGGDVVYFVELYLVELKPSATVSSGLDHYMYMDGYF